MICKYCYKKNPDDAGFCAECGKKLGDAADDCQTMEPSKPYEAVTKAKTKNSGMNPWVVIILLAIGIGSCFCFGGNKFTDEQKEFLHSIGIKNTEIEEKLDNGRYVLEKGYENDHERIVVKVKPGDKGIDEVRYKNCEKLYWNKELGKVGMNKADSEKYIGDFTKKHRIDFDDKNYITYLDNLNFPHHK